MELSSVFGGDSLKAADLQGREVTVVIADVKSKEFDNGNKLIITFQGKKKALICNKTNANRIAYVHGTNTDNWIGKEVILYTDLVDFQGKLVEAIRVKPSRAGAGGPPAPQPRRAAPADDFGLPPIVNEGPRYTAPDDNITSGPIRPRGSMKDHIEDTF